jgi:tetratricopeptide (TPR) repeat protein
VRRIALRLGAGSVAAALSLAAAHAPSQDEDVLSSPYVAALRRYESGQRSAALADVASWPETRVRGEIERLVALRHAARTCTVCGAQVLWQRLPLRAGLMLHADAALGDRRTGRSARLAESVVAAYVDLMQDDPVHASFVRRLLEATVAVHHLEMRWDTALHWGDRALKVAPGSVPVLLAMAAIEETAGTLVTPAERPDATVEPSERGLFARVEADRQATDSYRRARSLARRALASDPASAEARLRLGRIAWRLGEPGAAKVELEAVAKGDSPQPLAFLAWLFLGGVLEDEGRVGDAVGAYEEAVALRPRDQAAGVALSEARHRLGDLAGARAAVVAGLSGGARRAENDPYWDYPFSTSTDALDRLEALRGEVAP